MTTEDRESDDSHADPQLEDIPMSLDVLLDLLVSEHRRVLLEYLSGQVNNECTFEEATREIITKIGRKQGYQPNHNDIRVALHHHHIPELTDTGVIEYDVQSQTIRYTQHDQLETIYDRVKEFEKV